MKEYREASHVARTTERNNVIRPCGPDDKQAMLEIVNSAATAYRGVIPDDRWRDPYMSSDELSREIADGVRFTGCEHEGALIGVMGLQKRAGVYLIRHAYVLPASQQAGIGRHLLQEILEGLQMPVLVGTWAAAHWAIGFYTRNGFVRVTKQDAERLLRRFWHVPDRQIETSVVLSHPELDQEQITRLVAPCR